MAQAFAGAPPAPFALNYTRKRPLRGHCAPPLHETDQSSLRPLGLTSWTFIVNFLDICSAAARSSTSHVLARFLRQRIKEARCTYVHTPYMKEPIRLRPLGLTSWTFIVILIAEMDLLKFYRRLILLFREYYKGILFLAGNFLQII